MALSRLVTRFIFSFRNLGTEADKLFVKLTDLMMQHF